jgi:hypothetical protein
VHDTGAIPDHEAGREQLATTLLFGLGLLLGHVSVQKFTTTTCPRNSAAPSGSELSHSVAPPSDGMCTRASTVT